jgi:hypothetical protein
VLAARANGDWSPGYDPTMAVRARLDGHGFDLDALTWEFPCGDPYVGKDDDSQPYYLASERLDHLFSSPAELHEAAQALLLQLNGLARAMRDDFRPVRLVGRYNDTFGNVHQIVVVDTVEARDQVMPITTIVGGVVQERATPGIRYFAASSMNADVAEVLAILGHSSVVVTWVEMYKVFEIVRENLHPRRIVDVCSATDLEVRAFTASANRPEISGNAARHARLPGLPPRRTMSMSHARSFVGQLVVDWLNEITRSEPGAS